MTHVYAPATAIFDPNGIAWGMHPIAWRNDDIPEVGEWNTIDVMFDDLAEAGFAGTEAAGWYPSKEETKEKADATSLTIVAQWFSSFILCDEGIEAVMPGFRATCELRYLGATRVVVSEQTGSVQGVRDICIFDNKPVLADEKWPVLAQGLNELSEIAHEYGLDLVYHHHLGTVIQTNNEALRLLELTDSGKVSLLFDTGHAFVGDGDVMGLLHLEYLPPIGALAPVVLACAWAGRRLAAPFPNASSPPSDRDDDRGDGAAAGVIEATNVGFRPCQLIRWCCASRARA